MNDQGAKLLQSLHIPQSRTIISRDCSNPFACSSFTYKLELDAVDDRSRTQDERGEAGEDDHGIK